MAYLKGLTATLAELEAFYRSENAGDILELCNQTNDILSDVQFMESNQSDGHVTRIRTGLPPVYWRRLYRGTPPGKSQWTQVKEGCSMLEAHSELDVKELELYGDRARPSASRKTRPLWNPCARRWPQPCSTATMMSGQTNSTDSSNAIPQRTPPTSSTPAVPKRARVPPCGSSPGAKAAYTASIPKAPSPDFRIATSANT